MRPGSRRKRAGAVLIAGIVALVIATGCAAAPLRDGGRAAHSSWASLGVGHWPRATWRPYGPTSPFNRPIAARDRVHPRSRSMVARILSWGPPASFSAGVADTPNDYGHPVYFARTDDPVVTLRPTQPWGQTPLRGARIHVPTGARSAGGSDAHMTVVTPDGWEYDLWDVQSVPRSGGTLRFGWGGRLRIDGDGLGSGATAAEFGSLAGIIRAAELRAGRIDHALFVVLKCTSDGTRFGQGVQRHRRGDGGSSFVFPAGKGGTRCPASQSDAPPMGARLALDMTPRQIAALPVPDWKKTILRALARYGGYVGDTGGTGFGLQFESGSTYTSFGRADPLVGFAESNGVPGHAGVYRFGLADGVDWRRHLRVLVPPRRRHAR